MYQEYDNRYQFSAKGKPHKTYSSGRMGFIVSLKIISRWILAIINALCSFATPFLLIYGLPSYSEFSLSNMFSNGYLAIPLWFKYVLIGCTGMMLFSYSFRPVQGAIRNQKKQILLQGQHKQYINRVRKEYNTKLKLRSEQKIYLSSAKWYHTFAKKHWALNGVDSSSINDFSGNIDAHRRSMNRAIWAHYQIQVLLQAIYLMKDGVQSIDGKKPLWEDFIDSCQLCEGEKSGFSGKVESFAADINDMHKDILHAVAKKRKSMNANEGNQFCAQLQKELVEYIEKWKNNDKYHKDVWTFFKDKRDKNEHFGNYISYSDTSTRSFPININDSSDATKKVQRAMCELLYMIEKSNFTILVAGQSPEKSYAEFKRMKNNLAKDIEFKISKRLPNEKFPIVDFLVGLIGVPNAACNSLMLIGTGYHFILGFFGVGFASLVSTLLVGAAGFYMSYAFTFSNVKKFINSLKTTRTLPLHHQNQMGKLNIFFGLMMGTCSSVFCFDVVKRLFVGPNAICLIFARQFGVEALYLAHLGIAPLVIASLASVITLICAGFLYVNQCLGRQRKEYSANSFSEVKESVVNQKMNLNPSGMIKPILVILATLTQIMMFSNSLRKPFFIFKLIGWAKYFTLVGVLYVWSNTYSLTYEEVLSANIFHVEELFKILFSPIFPLWDWMMFKLGFQDKQYGLDENFDIKSSSVKAKTIRSAALASMQPVDYSGKTNIEHDFQPRNLG